MCAELSMQKEGKRVASGPHGHPGNETRRNPHGGRWVSISRAHADPLHRASSPLWRRSKFTYHVCTWFCIRLDISLHSSSTRWDGTVPSCWTPRVAYAYVYTCFLSLHTRNFSPASCTFVGLHVSRTRTYLVPRLATSRKILHHCVVVR
jgi:hypothetical protein